MNEPNTLADRLRFARNAWAQTQDELADESGVGVATIRRIEGGSYEPRIDTTRKLAEALRVRVEWLAFGSEPMVALYDLTGDEQVRAQSGPGSAGLPGFVVIEGGVWERVGATWGPDGERISGEWRVVRENAKGAR